MTTHPEAQETVSDDLVQRLRRLSVEGWAVRYEHDYILVDAADTIERLQSRRAAGEEKDHG